MSVVQSTKVLVGLFASIVLVSSSVVMSRAGNAQDQPAGAPSNGNQLVQSANDDSDPFADSSTRLTVGNSPDVNQATTNTINAGNPYQGIGGTESLRPFDNKIRSQSEIAILKALGKSTSVEFQDETLDVFIQYISSQFDVNIHFDSHAITEIGGSGDAPIEDVKLKNLTLNEVLSLVLEPMGLGFTVHKSALLITTKEREQQLLETRVYKFDREKFGVDQGDELIEMITTLVQPDSWSEQGGSGEIVIVKNGFAVTQSFGIHERIHALLAQLERNVDTKKS